jgi:serine/threonine-protein kinase
MRYVDGPALSNVIDQEVFLEADRVANLASQVAGALDEAHERGFVHRDVKPQNILLTEIGQHEFAYLSDFGLARAIEDTGLTRTGLALGTPSYMAPEQILGRPVDKAADIYSLGCVLYECLTGAKPFEHENSQAILYAHANEPPPAASEANNLLPPLVDEVLVRAMAKDPYQRHESAGDLAESLRSTLISVPGEDAIESGVEDGRLAEIRRLHPRAYERWTTEEDLALTQARQAGESVASLAMKHQRQPSAIRSRLEKLGLS